MTYKISLQKSRHLVFVERNRINQRPIGQLMRSAAKESMVIIRRQQSDPVRRVLSTVLLIVIAQHSACRRKQLALQALPKIVTFKRKYPLQHQRIPIVEPVISRVEIKVR